MRYFIFSLLAAVGWLGFYVIWAYASMPVLTQDNAYLCRYIEEKQRLAEKIQSPKLLIVGGSNAYVGLSASLIEQRLAIPSFNFGIHAALGPAFLFHLAKPTLKSGDTVLLVLEYSQYGHSTAPSETLVATVLGHGRHFLSTIGWYEALYILLSQTPKDLLVDLFSDQSAQLRETTQPIFGSHGDATYNLDEQVTPEMAEYVATARVGIGININTKPNNALAAISQFIQWCQQEGITVLATWPNTTFHPEYQAEFIQQNLELIRDFYAKHHVLLLGDPYDAMLAFKYFYDTPYHLTQTGVRKRTEAFLPLLQEVLD